MFANGATWNIVPIHRQQVNTARHVQKLSEKNKIENEFDGFVQSKKLHLKPIEYIAVPPVCNWAVVYASGID